MKNNKRNFIKIVDSVGELTGYNKNANIILCYHSFSNSGNKYNVDVSDFKKQILLLKKKYKFVSLEEIMKPNNGGLKLSLTIDDGYRDVLLVSEFLSKLKIPATLFVLSNPKKANRKELDHKGSLLSVKEINKLKKDGFTIGSHSATHADFSLLSEKQKNQEILNSKKELEKKLNTKIEYFAYPKGVYVPELLRVVKSAGYKAGFSTDQSYIKKDNNKFAIPRIVVDGTVSLEYLPVFISKTRLKTISLFGIK